MGHEGHARVLRTRVWKFEKPAIIGATMTVSMPAPVAMAICARMQSRSPDRLGT
jgi:hypothetical protein